MQIDLTRYSEDKNCVTPEGLREKLLADLGPTVEKMKLQRNRCLVATYVKPSVTAGGIIIPVTTGEEDRWQGKVGLLLAVGPSAFNYDEVSDAVQKAHDLAQYEAHDAGQSEPTDEALEAATNRALDEVNVPRVGDWVAYRTSETHEFGVPVAGEHTLASCRFILDESIVMVVADPRIVY